jgi:hypothetical protein
MDRTSWRAGSGETVSGASGVGAVTVAAARTRLDMKNMNGILTLLV